MSKKPSSASMERQAQKAAEAQQPLDSASASASGAVATMSVADALRQRTEQSIARKIPWDGYARANLLTEQLVAPISRLSKLLRGDSDSDPTPEDVRRIIAKQTPDQLAAIPELILELLSKINKDETLHYLLCVVGELVQPQPHKPFDTVEEAARLAAEHKVNEEFRREMVKRFLETAGASQNWPFEPFTRLLSRANNDWFSNAKAAGVVTELLTAQPEGNDAVIAMMADWFTKQLRKSDERDTSVAVHCLMRFVRVTAARDAVAKDALPLLAGHLKSRIKNVQLVYEITHVVWLLSYNEVARSHTTKTAKLIPILVEVLKDIKKDKVLRMVLGSLTNLAGGAVVEGQSGKAPKDEIVQDAIQQMIDCGLQRPLAILREKQWADEDISRDVESLQLRLAHNVTELSSFEVYKKEVLSGKLDWTLVHKSEKFWLENATRLEEDKFKLLLMVKELMTSDDPLVREVACYDVGEFARHHPRGKTIVNDLGMKVPLMERMMSDDDEAVKKQALMAIQKLMVTNWNFQSM